MSRPNAPFCWQKKETLRGIRESLDGDGGLASVLSVYHALTEIASDMKSDEFTTMQSHIGKLSGGLSTSTVKRCIKELRALNVISYELSRLRGPLRFTLNRNGSLIPNDRSKKSNDGSHLPNDRSKSDLGKVVFSRRTLEESSEEIPAGVALKSRKRSPSTPQVLPSIPSELDTPAFHIAWDEWIQHRKEKGRPLTPSTASKQLHQVGAWGEARAIAAIDYSILKGWQGIFENQNNTPPQEQIVPSIPKLEAPEGWEGTLKELYPNANDISWDQLTQLHPDIADQVRQTMMRGAVDAPPIAQNTP
jgi:hypothetical protein